MPVKNVMYPLGRRMRFFCAVGLLAAINIAASGCASSEVWEPPPNTLRQQLGLVAIVDLSLQTVVTPVAPLPRSAGQGAVQGFGQGVSDTFNNASGGGQFAGLVFFIWPITGAIRALRESVNSLSQEEIDRAGAEIRTFLQAERLSDNIIQHMMNAAESNRGRVPIRRPETADCKSPGACNDLLAKMGFNSVLELSTEYWFDVDADGSLYNPYVTPTIAVGVRLQLLGSDAEPYRREWRYTGHSRNYSGLSADSARQLRLEFQNAYSKLADRITNDLFATTRPEPRTGRSEASPGTVWTYSVDGQEPPN